MIQTQLPDSIRQLLSRELQVAKMQKPREVCKDKNIKRNKDNSRSGEELVGFKVSDETCLLAPTSSSPMGELDISREDLTSSKVEGNNISGAASSSIRGISVQHARTASGVKVMVNIQTHADAETGSVVELTAELKRSERLRELKPYDADSDSFAQMYAEALQTLKDMKASDRRPYCIGRIHDRGVRDLWYADMMAIGTLDDTNHLRYILLNINGEEFEIDMTETLSPRQQQAYHSSGRWGSMVTQRKAPTLATAPRKAWK